MNYEIGYHIVSDDIAKEHGRFDDKLSIVEFLRLVRSNERIPLNVTVVGLDKLLFGADKPESACDLVHDVLVDGVNHLTREQPVVQFVVDDIEHWDEAVITHRGNRVRLSQIFYGGLTQEGADWYSSRLNVTS